MVLRAQECTSSGHHFVSIRIVNLFTVSNVGPDAVTMGLLALWNKRSTEQEWGGYSTHEGMLFRKLIGKNRSRGERILRDYPEYSMESVSFYSVVNKLVMSYREGCKKNRAHQSYSSDFLRIRSCLDNSKAKCIDHILIIDLYVDSVNVYTVSSCSASVFVVNMVIQNAHTTERYSKVMSHYLTIVQKKEDIEPVLNAIIHDINVSGRNGAFYRRNNTWHHVRWGINGIRGDTVAQEEVEGLKGKMKTAFPCLFDQSCRCYRYSPMERSLVPMTGGLYTTDSKYLKVLGRGTDTFPTNSPYRFLSYLLNNASCLDNLTANQAEVVQNLRRLFNPSFLPPLWTPPSLTSEEMRRQHSRRVKNAFQVFRNLGPEVQQRLANDTLLFISKSKKKEAMEEDEVAMEEDDQCHNSDDNQDDMMADSEEMEMESENATVMDGQALPIMTDTAIEYDLPSVNQDASSTEPVTSSATTSSGCQAEDPGMCHYLFCI